MMLYHRFYQRYGIRRARQLAKPRRVPLSLIELPRGSVLHFMPESQTQMGPDNDEYIFRNVSKPILMETVTELTSFAGNPILKPEPIMPLIREYLVKHRRYRRLINLEQANRDPQTQIVVNYSPIARRYRYPKNQYAGYHAWANLQRTFWSKINATATATQRQQFIKISVPTSLPSVSELVRFSDTLNSQVLRTFHTDELKVFLELWKWFGEARHNSMLNAIEAKNLDKINLLFIDKHVWFVLNLGRINAMRRATEAERAVNPDAPETGVEPKQLARFLLFGMHEFIKQRSASDEEIEAQFSDSGDDEGAIADDTSELEREDLVDQTAQGEEAAQSDDKGAVLLDPFKTGKRRPDDIVIDLTPGGEGEQSLDEFSAQIEEQLNFIDEFQSKIKRAERAREEAKETTPEAITPNTPVETPITTPEEGFRRVADLYAQFGQISPAEYRRFERLSTSYKKITLENGQTLEEFAKIEPEVLDLPEPTTLPVGGVTNPNMAGSTLEQFDAHYINNVMEKDVVNAVLAIQNSGIAVTGFERTEHNAIDGDYIEYAVKVVPIDGAPSTLRFRLPKVSEEGIFKVNGVEYRYRKQQGVHMPIKKVSHDSVALTSYFAKNFVRRPSIKASDYGNWLCNAIKLKSLDNELVSDVQLLSAYEPTFKAPRLFTYLAKEFSAFTLLIEGVRFEFNFKVGEREAFFGTELINQLEQNGTRLVAKGGNQVLYIDKNDRISRFDGQTPTILGTIEELLELDSKRAPLEYTQLSVMGREIPVGVILGFERGLSALLEELGASQRRVPAGERLRLAPHEYAIRFADETLVLDRTEVYATLLLAGFTKYHQAIANYNIHEFDSKEVYFNILDESGAGSRVWGEIELRYQMFVDPITFEILTDMGEPTSFGGLLRRATEMLTDDYVPVVKDRVRGYERFAGTVYNEIVRSVRAHQNRFGRDRVPLDFSPFSVMQALMTDPAKMQATEINPVEDLKQVEAMSYSGTGGRSEATMTKETRIYRKEEQGLVSEATVDSSKVAVNTYTSANPKFNSVRGTFDTFDLESDDVSRLVSTSMLLSPGADREDLFFESP